MALKRREVMQLGAATLAGAALPSCAVTNQSDGSKADAGDIDSHVHVWSGDLKNYPLGSWATRADMRPATFTDQQMLAIAEPYGINRAVLIQHAPLHGYDNSYILDCARKQPDTFSVVAMINERTPHLKERLRDLRDQGARGIRIGPNKHADRTLNVDPPNWLNAPGMQLLWKYAAELGVAICPLLGPTFLPSVDLMCEQYPDTTLVIDHFGHIDSSNREQVRWLIRLAQHANVNLKVSGFYKFGDKQAPYDDLTPMIRIAIDAFGPDRLMWGSDLPYQKRSGNTFGDAVALIRDGMGLSESERRAIMRETAERIFF